MQYWLMKTEPGSYSIDDLKRDKSTPWNGVRNYLARNFMRAMKKGDQVLIYHSSSGTLGIFGVGKVVKEYYPDPTQFDAKDSHYDPKSKKENPMWGMVDIGFVQKFAEPVTLGALKLDPFFKDMRVTQTGSRLSVQPVSEKHFAKIVKGK